MKVLYWNLCSEVDPQISLQETSRLIQDEKIDVACLQEVPYVNQEVKDKRINIPLSQILAKNLEMEQVFEHTRTITRTDEKIRGYGSAVLTRALMVEQQTSTIRDDRFSYMTAHPDNRRVLLSVRTETEPDVMVNVAHMSYSLPFRVGSRGMHSERQSLHHILEKQMDHHDVVFGGDLNAQPGKSLDLLLETLDLRSVLDNSIPTFRSRHWFAGHIKRNLDRVFTSVGLQSEGKIGNRRHSDHHPVIVEVGKK